MKNNSRTHANDFDRAAMKSTRSFKENYCAQNSFYKQEVGVCLSAIKFFSFSTFSTFLVRF